MTRADDASHLAELGFRIFPLRPGSKIPPQGVRWKEVASDDPDKARKLWSNGHADFNIGVRTGSGLVVLDFDTKDGRSGLADLAALDAVHDLPTSYRVRTPSGGIHVYLRAPADVCYANAVGTIPGFPGMDVRADGGYVVGAGSVTPEGQYVPILGADIDMAPSSVLALLQTRMERTADAGVPVVDLDQPDAIHRAVKYLQQEAPTSVEGGGGDDTAYKVACRVLDFGLSQVAAIDVMLEHWNDRCSPPWEAREIAKKVKNAAAYRHEPIGSASPAADFGSALPQETPESSDGRTTARFPLEQISHLRQLPTPKWLVRDWIPENAVGILYGKWGSGKTFIAFDLALHLAYGLPDWHGAALPPEGRDVLVLAREGHQGFLQRIEAFQRHHGLANDTDRLHFMRAPITFMNKGDFDALQKELAASGKRFGLVIVDTVARVLPGADMATPENITLFMERCSRLGHALGASVIGVHHENKTGSIMGSTYFEANSDFVYQVERRDAEGRSLSRGKITCTKMKDGPDQWHRELRFASVPVGGDVDAGADALDAAGASPEADGASLVLSSVIEPVSARRVSGGAASREALSDEALEAAVLHLVENGASLSPHKQARAHGRYAPAVIGKALGLRVDAAQELIERMTESGQLVLETGRGGARLAVGIV